MDNVAALRRPGLDVVHADLAALGYDMSRIFLSASDIGAPPTAVARPESAAGRVKTFVTYSN